MAKTLTKSGPKLAKGEDIKRAKLSIRGMYPGARQLLSRALNHELDKPPGEEVKTEDAWGIVHMVDGRPRQQVDTHITGQLTLTEQLRGLSETELVALRAMLAGSAEATNAKD